MIIRVIICRLIILFFARVRTRARVRERCVVTRRQDDRASSARRLRAGRQRSVSLHLVDTAEGARVWIEHRGRWRAGVIVRRGREYVRVEIKRGRQSHPRPETLLRLAEAQISAILSMKREREKLAFADRLAAIERMLKRGSVGDPEKLLAKLLTAEEVADLLGLKMGRSAT